MVRELSQKHVWVHVESRSWPERGVYSACFKEKKRVAARRVRAEQPHAFSSCLAHLLHRILPATELSDCSNRVKMNLSERPQRF